MEVANVCIDGSVVNKMWSIQTIEYYEAFLKQRILMYGTT